MDLERNLIDNVLESEIKLGHASTPISFYYPISSLMELLGCDSKGIDSAIIEFKKRK